MQKVLFYTALLSLATLIGGCSSFRFPFAYTITVRQGNIVDKEDLDALEVGMNKKQVRYLLGTPLIEDTFHPERWDYYFSTRKDAKNLFNYRITLHFDEELLASWDTARDQLRSEKEGLEQDDGKIKDKQLEQEKKDNEARI